MDTLREIGAQAGSTVILMPSGPGAVTEFFSQFAAMQMAVKAARVRDDDPGVQRAAARDERPERPDPEPSSP